jgi:two-component system, response regulator PdtaR
MTPALRIAVADDEPVVRDYFLRMLPRLGHKVVAAAANGLELVELCREQKPDLIIADVRMPELDGDVAIQQICRETPTPFILISAYSKPTTLSDGFGTVGRAYLTKPVKREDLEIAIERVWSQGQNHA